MTPILLVEDNPDDEELSSAAVLKSKPQADFHNAADYARLHFVGPGASAATDKPYGMTKLAPLTTSKVVGSPDPPKPFGVVNAYPKLTLSHPIFVARQPGSDRMWAIGAALTAGLYLVWPFIHGFAAYLVMMVVLEVVSQAGWSGRGAYTIDIFTKEERVQSQAFMRAALNIGFTVGALIGGLALATNSDAVVRTVPILTGLVLLLNTFWITRLPDPPAPPDTGMSWRLWLNSARVPSVVAE